MMEERDRVCLKYCRSMPGAIPIVSGVGRLCPLSKYFVAYREFMSPVVSGPLFMIVPGHRNLMRGANWCNRKRLNERKML